MLNLKTPNFMSKKQITSEILDVELQILQLTALPQKIVIMFKDISLFGTKFWSFTFLEMEISDGKLPNFF